MRLYFNPRCSKCRAAHALLEDAGYDPQLVDYQKTPLDAAALGALIDALDDEPAKLVRTDDAAYREREDADTPLDRDRIIQLLVDTPALMQRPVLEHAGRAVIARPVERVFDVVDPPHE